MCQLLYASNSKCKYFETLTVFDEMHLSNRIPVGKLFAQFSFSFPIHVVLDLPGSCKKLWLIDAFSRTSPESPFF